MVEWRRLFGRGSIAGARTAPKIADHPDFDRKTGTWKRRLWTPAEHNLHAEVVGASCYTDLAFARPELNAVRDAWFAAAAKSKALVPTLTDFGTKLSPFLAHVTIVDCLPQPHTRSRYRVRLQGSETTKLFGDLTARYFDEYFPRENLPRWLMGFDVVIDTNAPLRFITRFELPLLSHLEGEAFSAPLASEEASARTILSVLFVQPTRGIVADAEQVSD